MTKFKVIDGTPHPDSLKQRAIDRVRSHPKPASMISCHRCGGREMIETRIGATLKNGKPSGGTKQMICALCMLKGQRVVVA